MMNERGVWQWKMETELGDLFLVATGHGLRSVFWSEAEGVPYLKNSSQKTESTEILRCAKKEMTEYLAGERSYFEVPLDIQGTPFQKRVWKQLLKIKYGETKSYKDIAAAIDTKAIRAVGSANGRNPLCIIIPCHRVIASNGGLGGYSGGLKMKQFLLSLESRK